MASRRKGKDRRSGGSAAATDQRPRIVPWRTRVADLRERLREWSRTSYGAALDAFLEETLPADASEADRARVAEDFVCQPGSAGDGSSILRVFADHASGLDDEAREQVRRWEPERRRGVFVVQTARRDRLGLWDPLDGAPLTLHLLEKLSANQLGVVGRGTVVTVVFQPWMARLVAVEVEFFRDPRALALFRDEVAGSDASWHEPPAPAPERGRSG